MDANIKKYLTAAAIAAIVVIIMFRINAVREFLGIASLPEA